MKLLKPNFSNIYIERGAVEYPLSKIAQSKFMGSNVIEIDHYKDIFNRRGQDSSCKKDL